MHTISPADICALARSIEGSDLHTRTRNSVFKVKPADNGLIITPLSTNKPRAETTNTLKCICDEFSSTNSLRPTDYQRITINSSYVLTLISLLLKDDIAKAHPLPENATLPVPVAPSDKSVNPMDMLTNLGRA
jgi:hypothetical protein